MLKTYTREELKQLEGKRVRIKTNDYWDWKICYEWILVIIDNQIEMKGKAGYITNTGYITNKDFIQNYQFELLENEFEVGEEVEVRDEEEGIRQPRIYLCTVPWNTRYPHIVVDCRFIEEYSKGKIFLNEDFRYIRKIQPKPEPKKMTMEELNKELWYEVEIVEKK